RIKLRLVGVMQDVHHVRAANAGRIIETSLVVAPRLEVFDPLLSPLLHLVLRAENNGLGRASLLTCRPKSNRDAVRAERAFVGLVVDLRDARDVEGAALHAVATADAVLLDEINDSVRILHDGAGRWARLETTRILAVHTAVLADQPLEVTGVRVLPLGVTHQRPGVRREIVGILVDPHIHADLLFEIVPREARRLTGLAADAFRNIDQLG